MRVASVDFILAFAILYDFKASCKSTSALFFSYSKFENGLIDNVAFLQSLTEKYDAISQHKKAINDLEVKKATIIYHSGEKLQEYIR